MSAKSLIRKLKQLFGHSDRSGSERESGPSATTETEVTVEREPEEGSQIDSETAGTTPADEGGTPPAEPESGSESPSESSGDPVEKIKGIGPTYSDRLESDGIESVADLAASDAETVADIAQTSEGRAAEWVERAKNW